MWPKVSSRERIYPNLWPMVNCAQKSDLNKTFPRPKTSSLRVAATSRLLAGGWFESLREKWLKILFHILYHNNSVHIKTQTSPLYSTTTPVGRLFQLYFPSYFAGTPTNPFDLLFLVYSETVAAIFFKTSVTECCHIPEDYNPHSVTMFAYHIVCLRPYTRRVNYCDWRSTPHSPDSRGRVQAWGQCLQGGWTTQLRGCAPLSGITPLWTPASPHSMKTRRTCQPWRTLWLPTEGLCHLKTYITLNKFYC